MSAAQGSCRVQRVAERGRESWTVIGADRRPVESVDRYLAWLTNIEKSPNTVRAYACDLKLFVTFLAARELAWDQVSLETLGEFTAWLRGPAENVIVLEHGTPARAASSVNRTLSAVFGFYEFHARSGVPLARELVARGRSGYGAYKPFLHGIAKARPRGRVGRLREVERLPRVLSVAQVQAILDVQQRQRIGSCSRCCSRRGCGSVKRWGFVTRMWSAGSGGSRSARAMTTPTAPVGRAGAGACRYQWS